MSDEPSFPRTIINILATFVFFFWVLLVVHWIDSGEWFSDVATRLTVPSMFFIGYYGIEAVRGGHERRR